MRLDSAKQAFSEIGLGDRSGNRNWNPNNSTTTTGPTNAINNTSDTKPTNVRFNQRTPINKVTGRGAQEKGEPEVLLEATGEVSTTNTPEESTSTYPRIPQEEWNRRMKNGECGLCGSKEHRYREHFRQNGPKTVTARGAFTEEYEIEDNLYVEIEGFNEQVHIEDPVLESLDANSGN